jgi:hypothetical protein
MDFFKIIVLHVGTNNTKNSADAVAEGIEKLITTIRKFQPDVYIIFPVGTLTLRFNSIEELKKKRNFLFSHCCQEATYRTNYVKRMKKSIN